MRQEVELAGGRFLVEEAGSDATRYLWLHDEIAAGLGGFGEALARSATVTAPIHPGFSSAPRPEWVESIRDVVEHNESLYRAFGVGPETVVVGASMGGWIAAELAARRFGELRALVLIAPFGVHVPGHSAADFWFRRDRDELLFNDPSAMPKLELDEQVANEESAARYGWSPRLFDPSLAPRLDRITCPVLLVWPEEDRVLPRQHRERWQELLPDAEVAEMPGLGHFPGHEAPQETADVVHRFVATLPDTKD